MNNNLKVVCGTLAGVMIGGLTVVGANQAIQAIQNTEIKVSLNGQIQNFKDETTGVAQYPITYDNRTYLPLRNVANLAGLNVDYDSKSNTAILTSKNKNDNLEDLNTLLYLNENLNKIKKTTNYYAMNGDLYQYAEEEYYESVDPREVLESDAKKDPKKQVILKILDLCGNRIEKPINYYYDEELGKNILNGVEEAEEENRGGFYDRATYNIESVHNGIVYVSKYIEGMTYELLTYHAFDTKTGEEYKFPKELENEIYDKAVDVFLSKIAEKGYNGLVVEGYILSDNEKIRLIDYSEDGQIIPYIDNIKKALLNELKKRNSFEITNDNIIFHIDPGYTLVYRGGKYDYLVISIPNEWNI